MYHITQARVNNLRPMGWYKGDHILLAVGRIVWGVKRYSIAFDVQPVDDSYCDGHDFEDFYPPTEFYFSSGEFE